MYLIEKVIAIILCIVTAHIAMSILMHKTYYDTLDKLLHIDTQTVHEHKH